MFVGIIGLGDCVFGLVCCDYLMIFGNCGDEGICDGFCVYVVVEFYWVQEVGLKIGFDCGVDDFGCVS